MKLFEVMEGVKASNFDIKSEIEISGISYNTKNLKKGDLFVAIKGYAVDGHDYIEEAKNKGAVAIIAENCLCVESIPVIIVKNSRVVLSKVSANYYGNPSNKLNTFCVTGTNGKTTITYMIQKILEGVNNKCGVIGTIGYQVGSKFYDSLNTTPESYEMQKLMNEMVTKKITSCAMEITAHALFMNRVLDVKMDYGIFTNLSPDHLDFFENMENYFNTKCKMFDMIQKASVVNIDDEYGKRLYKNLKEKGKSCYSYSLKETSADYYAKIEKMDDMCSTINLKTKEKNIENITINTPGLFSIYNVIATAAILNLHGVKFEHIIEGIKKVKGVPGRFERVDNSKNMIIIVDYAHTPDALENVLKTANSFKKGRLICVFGCGGDRDAKKRPLMGNVAGTYSDYCIITSDNPRTEEPMKIIRAAEEGIYETGCNYLIEENRYEAIKKAIKMYKKNDVIVIAGKGHENYQVIGTKKIHFDDKETAKEIIESF